MSDRARDGKEQVAHLELRRRSEPSPLRLSTWRGGTVCESSDADDEVRRSSEDDAPAWA